MHIKPIRVYVDSQVGSGWRLCIQVGLRESSYLVDWGTFIVISRKEVQGTPKEVPPIENFLAKVTEKVKLYKSLGVTFSEKEVEQIIFWLQREQKKLVKPKGFARKAA